MSVFVLLLHKSNIQCWILCYVFDCKVRFLYDYCNSDKSDSTVTCFMTTKTGVPHPLKYFFIFYHK